MGSARWARGYGSTLYQRARGRRGVGREGGRRGAGSEAEPSRSICKIAKCFNMYLQAQECGGSCALQHHVAASFIATAFRPHTLLTSLLMISLQVVRQIPCHVSRVGREGGRRGAGREGGRRVAGCEAGHLSRVL